MDRADLPFGRAAFVDWHATYEAQVLKPAAGQLGRSLQEFLDEIAETDPGGRIRLGPPRFKSVNRTWQKVQNAKYASQVSELSDVPRVVDDLLGFRLVCTNREDVDDVVRRLLEEFPVVSAEATSDDRLFVAIEDESIRDYVREPKPSGYRAFHLNLMTWVGSRRDGWATVRAEIQVRTLLQDAWGELTHEDTYKPHAVVGEFVQTLSLRMAEVLVVLDSLAQDLRSELERGLVEVAESGEPLFEDSEDEPRSHGRSAVRDELVDPVKTYIRQEFAKLQKPQELASFAWQLQREFGTEVTGSWLGYGKMTSLLADTLPAEALITESPGLLVPLGFDLSTMGEARHPLSQRVPEKARKVALRLKSFDSGFPLLDGPQLELAYGYLADAHNSQRGDADEADFRHVNLVTKMARDAASADGEEIGRRDLDYIFMALFRKRRLKGRLTGLDIAGAYSDFVVERCRRLEILSSDELLADQESQALHDRLRWTEHGRS